MMQPLDPIVPDEAHKLAMENDLLRYEVRHLRARLAALTPTEPATPAGPGKGGQKRGGQAERQDRDRQARNRQAYDDIVWLVGRLDTSPAGPLLRRIEGFRTLRSRYLPGSSA